MAGQINISGSTEAVQLHGNDDYTVARDFTFPDESGELLIKDANDNVPGIGAINNGPLAGMRSVIINGDFRINQRGITDTSSRNLYFVDRWFKGDSAGRIVVVDSSLSGFDKMLSFSGTADSPIYQSVELPRTGKAGSFSIGSTWTLSCYARCASGGNVRLSKRFVNDTNQNVTDETAETFTLDTNWQHISFTFTIAAAPNAANTALQVIFTSLTANEVFVTGVQLEPGPVATMFEMRPIGTELALCQRYYQVLDWARGMVTSNDPTGRQFFAVRSTPLRTNPVTAETYTQSGTGTVGATSSTATIWRATASGATAGNSIDLTDWRSDAEL